MFGGKPLSSCLCVVGHALLVVVSGEQAERSGSVLTVGVLQQQALQSTTNGAMGVSSRVEFGNVELFKG